MSEISKIAQLAANLPPDRLLIMLALGAFALSAFAIYAVHSIAKDRER